MWEELGGGSADDAILAEILSRAGKRPRPPADDWTLQSKVAMLNYVPKNKPFLIGTTECPDDAQKMLEASPDIAKLARWLLVEFCPCDDPRYRRGSVIGGCYGCATDNIADFGRIYSSNTDPVGFVEGLVSSLANWKLYALGIKHYEWTNEFITVDETTQFDHPLRMAEKVPVGTVLHTMYCMQHILHWYRYLRVMIGATPGVQYRIRVAKDRIKVSLPQIRPLFTGSTKDGNALLQGMVTWAQTQLNEKD